MDRAAAVARLERLVEAVETEPMPVPIREVWTFGDVALGLDPVERLDVYLTKDLLLHDEAADWAGELEERFGAKGIGRTVRSEWAERFPDRVRTNPNGYAAPAECLAATLVGDDEPIHLEVCNTGFEDNVTQRLRGAAARGAFETVLDPRGVCLWVDGERSPTAFDRLRDGDLVFPTLPDALVMLGLDEAEADRAAEAVRRYRETRSGATVRGDVL